MDIKIEFIGHLKDLVNDVESISFNGNTIGELLDQLVKDYPEIKDNIFGMNEVLLVMVLVDDKLIQKREVNDFKITEKNEIKVYPIAGGG